MQKSTLGSPSAFARRAPGRAGAAVSMVMGGSPPAGARSVFGPSVQRGGDGTGPGVRCAGRRYPAPPMRIALSCMAAIAAATAVLAAPASAQAPPAPVNCADPALRCPDLRMHRPYDLHIDRTRGGRTLLRASNAIVSVGRGPVTLLGNRPATSRTMSVRQRISTRSGGHVTVPSQGAIVFKHVPGQGG